MVMTAEIAKFKQAKIQKAEHFMVMQLFKRALCFIEMLKLRRE